MLMSLLMLRVVVARVDRLFVSADVSTDAEGSSSPCIDRLFVSADSEEEQGQFQSL